MQHTGYDNILILKQIQLYSGLIFVKKRGKSRIFM